MPPHSLEAGIVRAIERFPVKSMQGESLASAHLGWHGLDGDRRYAFLKTGDLSNFPWLTARDLPALVRYHAFVSDPADACGSAVRVRAASGVEHDVASPELLDELSRASGRPIQLVQSLRGLFDATEVSLLSLESVQWLERELGGAVDRRRFRANLVIECRPYLRGEFPEEDFVGGLLKFGDREDSASVRIHCKDHRCMMVNLDPQSAEQTPEILRTIASRHNNQFGVYGATDRSGTIAVGDVVHWRQP